MSHGGEQRSNREKRDGVYSCLFSLGKWNILDFSSYQNLLALSSTSIFTLWITAVVCGSGKGGAREMTLIKPFEWKGVFP